MSVITLRWFAALQFKAFWIKVLTKNICHIKSACTPHILHIHNERATRKRDKEKLKQGQTKRTRDKNRLRDKESRREKETERER